MLTPRKKSYDQPRQHIRKQRCYFANKGPSSQSYGFSSSHVWMWELDYKESWVPKNWCFWTVVLEKTLESPLDCKEIQPVNPKGNQPLNIHWKDWCWSWSSNTLANQCKELTPWKIPWCWERLKAGGEGDDRRWDSWMPSPTHGHEFEQAAEVGDGQRSLACCSPWGRKESDTTEQLDWLTMTYELCDLGALSHFQVPQFPHLLNDGNKWSYYYYQSNRFALKFKWGFPCGSAGKESTCNVGDLGSVPGLGRCPGEQKGYPLQYSGPEISMDCEWINKST